MKSTAMDTTAMDTTAMDISDQMQKVTRLEDMLAVNLRPGFK